VDESEHGPNGAWAFLWGKRRHRRQETELAVSLDLAGGEVAARAVNLSAGGALLRVATESLASLVPGVSVNDPFALHEAIGPTFAVRLGPGIPATTADLVRLAWQPGEPALLYLGCRFQRALGRHEIRTLGLEDRICTSEAGSAARPSDAMRWQAIDDPVVGIQVFRATDGAPLATGRCVAMDARDLAIRFADAEPTRLVADLAHARLVVRVVVGDRVVWDRAAWLLAVRVGGVGGPEVVLQVDQPPGRTVRRLFRDRGAFAAR